jgi:hypothetical protein
LGWCETADEIQPSSTIAARGRQTLDHAAIGEIVSVLGRIQRPAEGDGGMMPCGIVYSCRERSDMDMSTLRPRDHFREVV